MFKTRLLSILVICFTATFGVQADDTVIANFEGPDFGTWQVTGEALGQGPASHDLDSLRVTGYLGTGFASTAHGGGETKGVLTSPPFVITKDYINFLVGGGYHFGSRRTKAPKNFWGMECAVTLLVDPTGLVYSFDLIHTAHHRLAVDDSVVLRMTTGSGLPTDGALHLDWRSWDVRSLRGRTARIRIVDNSDQADGFLCVDQIVQGDRPLQDLLNNQEILARANENVRRGEATARPRRGYHFVPQVFGFGGHTALYHDGYYHLFYIYNPFLDRGDVWGHNFWKHARSRDLVFWEDLPVAIWPSEDNGEFYCASGTVVIDDHGVPRLFYTSRSSERSMDQMAAVGDPGLITWRKYPTNPIIVNVKENPLTHGTDPSVFKHEDKWYMLLGGLKKVGDEYRGAGSLHVSDDLINWEFAGVPFVSETRGWEEPDLFKLGDKWVVTVEPFGPSQYYIGSFDLENYQFVPESHGYLDYAGVEKHDSLKHDMSHFTGHYIVCGSFLDHKDRRICFGIGVGGFALPRILSLRPDGRLSQKPIPEIKKLRAEHFVKAGFRVSDESKTMGTITSDLLEVQAEFVPSTATEFGLKVRCAPDGTRFVPISCDGQQLRVGDETAPAKLMEGEETLRLHVFLDRHMLEVFANDWVVYTESITGSPPSDVGIEVFARGGEVTVKKLDIWRLSSIW